MIFSINYTPGIEKLTHNMNGSSPLFECSEDVVALLESSFFNRNNDQIFTKGILYTICSFYISQVTLSPREYTPNTGFMEESLKYITDGYTENITLLKLAEMLGYEYHYTSRLFHQNFKINFKYYVNCYRMNLAFDLLTNTNKKISEIAVRVGFDSIRSFNKCFLKYVGISPSEYRKNFNKHYFSNIQIIPLTNSEH